ncbi:MAG TPA: zinc ribbon domain-containing protein [Gemmatimonadaceae bacterium]|nr:zinc ribbon domain-containing protein [Gemmatimonadaceae bacterium]
MTLPPSAELTCPGCGTRGTGRFCSNCGTSLEGTTCSGCGAPLTPGAKFCHRCGQSANTAAAPQQAPAPRATTASSLPWIVAAIALVTLLAFFAGNAFNSKRASTLDAPQNALPQAGLDDRGQTMPSQGGQGAVRGPDISQLSTEQAAERLFNRVMIHNSQGQSDSVQFFAPMAISAYQMLTPMTADHRYDMGRIAEVAGVLPIARAQVDTILRQNPTHLLGLILGARIATLSGDSATRQRFESRFLTAYDAESKKRLPEYERHEDDIKNALTTARSKPRS